MKTNNIKKRLITFGCSYTYGIGLPDCKDEWDPPSKHGWPKLLSDKIDLDLINVSCSGASNFEIVNNIINFEFYESDTVVIMWTHYARDLFFRKLFAKKWPVARLGPWISNNLIDRLIDTQVIVGMKWVENMNDKTFALKSWAHIHHAGLYLKSLKLKHLHFVAMPNDLLKYPVSYSIDNFCTDGIVIVDRCEDGHPGIESNKKTADLIYTRLHE
jgi:hypothetical protein